MAITQNTYTGNGSTVLYSFAFPYLETTDVKVSINGTVTTAYTFANATTIQFNTAPANGAAIRIYRETDDSALQAVFSPGSSIRASDLNDNFDQTLYVVQEINNNAVKLADPLYANKTYIDAQDALKVNKAGDTMSGNLAMGNNKVTGLGAPTASADAVTKSYVDGYINTTYLGPQASDPATRPGGSPLQVGDQYFNTNQNILKAWTGTVWVISAAAGSIIRWRKTASAGNTTLSGVDDLGITLSYVVGNEQVFLNGALQTRGVDYTAATGTSITFTPALLAGDVVELHAVQGYVSATVPDGSVGETKLAAGAVTETKLADGAVTSAKILDNTIVNADVNASAGIVASKLSFTQTGTGAVTRTVDSKLKDVVSVKDFGATGDGVTDDLAAINNAFAELISRGRGTLLFPSGTYLITGSIGNQNFAGNTQQINIAVVGEEGTVINVNPASGINVALNLYFSDLQSCEVRNLRLQLNDLCARGIYIRSSGAIRRAQVDRCEVLDSKGVNLAGVTESVQPISITSGAFGFNAAVTNCLVQNVTRAKAGLACQGIVIVGFESAVIQNNNINNVRHSGLAGDLIDADGIVVFSLNTAGVYSRSQAFISGNSIRNCEGRFVKLQTNGSAVVANNLMRIDSVIDLITSFIGVDSQVANASVTNNKFYLLSAYTGGSSGAAISLSSPDAGTVTTNNEPFFQKAEGNEIYISTQRLTYGITVLANSGTTSNLFTLIRNNVVSRDKALGTTAADAALSRAIYITGTATLATFNGQWFMEVSNNRFSSSAGIISMQGTNNEDYADKWIFHIFNNAVWGSTVVDVFVTSGGGAPANNIPYTSTMMIRNNPNVATTNKRDRVRLPIDVAKIIPGSEFGLPDSGLTPSITNAPPAFVDGALSKPGGLMTKVEVISGGTARVYLTNNQGTTWLQA